VIGPPDATVPVPADGMDHRDTETASIRSGRVEHEETTAMDRTEAGTMMREAFSRRSLKREFASMLDMALFLAVPVGLWLFAPLDPWLWVLIGAPAMMAAMFLSSFIQVLLGTSPGPGSK
jgi:hypothetical protein